MRTANVPPPMALHELKLEEDTVDVAINSAASQVVVLDRTSISVYSYGAFSKQFSPPKLLSKHPLPAGCGTPSQISLRGDDAVFVLTRQGHHDHDQIYKWAKDSSKWEEIFWGVTHNSNMSTSLDFKTICIQNEAGFVDLKNPEFGDGYVELPVFCPWIELAKVGDEVSSDQSSAVSF
jgi:elongator complex protein 1